MTGDTTGGARLEPLEIVLAGARTGGPDTIEYNVSRFVGTLRRLGVRVSLAETVDALSALSRVDWFSRDQVRGALRACLAKSRKEAALFDQVFGLFFDTPEAREKRRREYLDLVARKQRALDQAGRELRDVLKDWRPDAFSPEQVETFSLLPDSEKHRLKSLIGKMKGNQINRADELINMVLQSSLNYWRYYMMKNAMENGGMDQILEAELTGEPDESLAARFYHQPGDRILHSDMERLADADIPRVTALINRLSARLCLSITRRYRNSCRARAVDIRRTIRSNMKYGGIPLELRYRARRKRRPNLLLICDVSASMARYARFVLQFIYGLSSAAGGIESFVFSEDLERVTGYFGRNRDFAGSMSEMVNGSRQWGQSTNLHQSLLTFRGSYWDKLTPETVVFIVSDTKTVAPRDAAALVGEVARRCADVIWLNTLPGSLWRDVPTVALFGDIVSMYECNTLAQLERSLRRHLFEKL